MFVINAINFDCTKVKSAEVHRGAYHCGWVCPLFSPRTLPRSTQRRAPYRHEEKRTDLCDTNVRTRKLGEIPRSLVSFTRGTDQARSRRFAPEMLREIAADYSLVLAISTGVPSGIDRYAKRIKEGVRGATGMYSI